MDFLGVCDSVCLAAVLFAGKHRAAARAIHSCFDACDHALHDHNNNYDDQVLEEGAGELSYLCVALLGKAL